MARAKRTNRAEARRRYRAQLAEQATDETVDQPQPSAQPPARAARPASGPAPSGMRYAFRAAFHPVNLRDDVDHLPQLLRSRAVLLPILVTVGTAVAIAATNGTDVVSKLLAQYFLVPPPIGSIFVAGFFAPRASYLAGFIVGLAAAIVLTVLVAATPSFSATGSGATASASPGPSASAVASPSASTSASTSPSAPTSPSATASSAASAAGSLSASPGPSGEPSPAASGAGQQKPANPAEVAGFALVWSPLTGILFASAAAWYRRFLQLSNPNRAAARGGARGKPSNRRR